MPKLITTLFLLSLVGTSVVAAPSEAIRSAMNSPASMFDTYLGNIKAQYSCRDSIFLEGSKQDHTPCITTLDYDLDDNLLMFHLFVGDDLDAMQNFSSGNDQVRFETLKTIAIDAAIAIGVADQDPDRPGLRFGIIQLTPMRYGWQSKTTALDIGAVIEEIANRSQVIIHARSGKDSYTVTRTHHGKFTFDKMQMPY